MSSKNSVFTYGSCLLGNSQGFRSSRARNMDEDQMRISYYQSQYYSKYLYVQVIVPMILSILGGEKAPFTRLRNGVDNVLFMPLNLHEFVP